MSIAENIAHIRREIAAAAKESGRNAEEITLVGASKMNDAAACREAIAAGIDALGGKSSAGNGGKAKAAGLCRRTTPLYRSPPTQQGQAGGGSSGLDSIRWLCGLAGGN